MTALLADSGPQVPSTPVQVGGSVHHGFAQAPSWQLLMVMITGVLFVGTAVLWFVAGQRRKLLARRRARRNQPGYAAAEAAWFAAEAEMGAGAPSAAANEAQETGQSFGWEAAARAQEAAAFAREAWGRAAAVRRAFANCQPGPTPETETSVKEETAPQLAIPVTGMPSAWTNPQTNARTKPRTPAASRPTPTRARPSRRPDARLHQPDRAPQDA